MSDGDHGYEHRFGFGWGPAEITRCASIKRSNGLYRIVNVSTEAGASLNVYISPTGRSLRVFDDTHGEWRPAKAAA